jgi:hypothetical protein
MDLTFRNLWTWEGTLSRGAYARIGVAAFAIKYVFDYFAASIVFGRPWTFVNYWIPVSQAIRITSLSFADARFLLIMLALSFPFIWVGVVCTLKRLRDAGMPLGWVFLFFLPIMNLAFFFLVCLLPRRVPQNKPVAISGDANKNRFDDWMSRSSSASAALAALLTGVAGFALSYFSIFVLVKYGWGLFVAEPFCTGFVAVLVHAYFGHKSFGDAMLVSCLSVFVSAVLLMLLGAEGAICIAMAAPLALPLAMAGGAIAYGIQSRTTSRSHSTATFSIVLLFVPLLMGAEQATHLVPPVYAVRSSIEIEAPPEAVWKQVVAFTQIPEPRELLFRAGIAYPIRAEIIGQGVGAERRCIFSTGAFVEPIEVWDEPHLLKFSVTSNPPPMHEWTPYSKIEPPHLKGFLVSNGGQFLLTALPGGHTRLEGTTWYHHGLWPAAYWRLWSDEIIHEIHMRVLRHIKTNTEQQVDRAQLN